MEILSAGAFINLENREKIEQLKYTATELANAANEADGFVNNEEEGKRLALDFWQGLEYLCRETEAATVKNIFVNHFLARLQELQPRDPATERNLASSGGAKANIMEPAAEKVASEDEFLGVVSGSETDEKGIERTETALSDVESFSGDENVPIAEIESHLTDDPDDELNSQQSLKESEAIEGEQSEKEFGIHPAAAEKAADSVLTPSVEKTIPAAFSLPEKEPYQFNKCTVTVVVQLLPVENDSIVRKAVLSVRTHNFAPQISLIELPAGDIAPGLAPEIEKALAKYQSDLPIKVMDKMKKEKSAPKKPVMTTSETKISAPQPAKKDASSPSQTAAPENNRAAAAAAPPPKVESSLQGSLF